MSADPNGRRAARQRRRQTPDPPPLPKRLASLAVGAGALPILVALSPLMIPVAVVMDLLAARPRLPTVRLYVLAIVFAAHEWTGQVLAAVAWAIGVVGVDTYDLNRRIQGWWTNSLTWWADNLLGLYLDIQDPRTMPEGTVIIASRHSSMLDAVVPAWLFTTRLDRPVHYVLKRELQWVPNLEVFGRRLRNHFVRRGGPDTEAEVAAIAAMATNAEPKAGIVIFPEGTYGSTENIARVRASLDRNGPAHLADLAHELQTVLPPRSAGTLAIMEACPDAPVVIFGHVGLELMADPWGQRRSIGRRHRVVVRWWVHDRDTIPTGQAEQSQWLIERWRELDQWVQEVTAEHG